ncbi:MAG: carbohydrate ABC transporter permease, partial [Caldilineaceae bacterium]|nr:carbohydrate ABC transporter permease [Caldilineaceae bacterium]
MFRKQRRVSLLPNYLILLLLMAFAIGPIAVLGFNSVKDRSEIAANPLGPPSTIRLENFPDAWREGKFATTVKNSVILVVSTVVAELIFAGMAAYSLARLNPPGENLFMLYMLVGSTLPIWLFLVPLFSLWRILGLINSLFGLILLYTAFNSPFSIFLLRSFMVQVPKDFDDAARVDGANTFQVFTRVLLPLTWPGFLTVGLIVGLGVWSEFQI